MPPDATLSNLHSDCLVFEMVMRYFLLSIPHLTHFVLPRRAIRYRLAFGPSPESPCLCDAYWFRTRFFSFYV